MAPRPVAPGANKIVLRCRSIEPGWALIHKAEADGAGRDRFAAQTCYDPDRDLSLFIPSVIGDKIRVHVYFSAAAVEGDVKNTVTCHALRLAAEESGWILVAVGSDDPPNSQISAEEITEHLAHHGLSPRIDALRMSTHSRGCFNLKRSLESGLLVDVAAPDPIVPPSRVERVVSFDSDAGVLKKALELVGIDSTVLFGYQVTVFGDLWTTPPTQTIQLASDPVIKKGVVAVAYARLVDDANTLRAGPFDGLAKLAHLTPPGFAVPESIDDAVTAMDLPPLGTFTSRRLVLPAPLATLGTILALPPASAIQSSVGGGVHFQTYCRDHSALTEKLVGREVDHTGGASEICKFDDAHDLARFGPSYHVSLFAATHHLIPAEFAHEVTDELPPQPG